MSIGITNSSGNTTGASTTNPQSINQTSTLQTGSSNFQSSINPDNIDNSSTLIPLGSQTASTVPISTTPTVTKHHISGTAFITISILLAVAIFSFLYIYMMSKKPNKYA